MTPSASSRSWAWALPLEDRAVAVVGQAASGSCRSGGTSIHGNDSAFALVAPAVMCFNRL